MIFKPGDKVKFVGRLSEIGTYHHDFSQLLGEIGTVRDVKYGAYVVVFDRGFVDSQGQKEFYCWFSEVAEVS